MVNSSHLWKFTLSKIKEIYWINYIWLAQDAGGETGSADALEMANVKGIFYLLALGILVAVLCAFIDVILETKKHCEINEVCSEQKYSENLNENLSKIFIRKKKS